MNVDTQEVLVNIKELKNKMNDNADKVELGTMSLAEWSNSTYMIARRELKKYMMSLKVELIKEVIILLELGQGGYIEGASNEEIYEVLKQDVRKMGSKEVSEMIEDMVGNSRLVYRLERGLDILIELGE